MDDKHIRELQQVDDQFVRFVDSAWNRLEDDVITSPEDKPEHNTVTSRYFKDHLQDVFDTKDAYDNYKNLWLHLLSTHITKTDFYKRLPIKGRTIYFANSARGFNPGAVDEKLLTSPKTVASALMYAVETVYGNVDIAQRYVNALILIDLLRNDKQNARKVLNQLGLGDSEIASLIKLGDDGRFVRDNVVAVLSEFSGNRAVYDTLLKKVLDKLIASNISLLSGTIYNSRLLKKAAAMRYKTVKVSQATSPTAQDKAITQSESVASYSSIWPVLLALAGLSAMGIYAYYNWFGSNEEDEKERIIDLSNEDQSTNKDKRRVVIRL